MSLLLAWLFASWAQEPAAPPFTAEEEVVSDPVWTAVPVDERVIDGVPLLGPWPDDWRPQVDGQAGLPTLDLVLGKVLDPGHPYLVGPTAGPAPPPAPPAPAGALLGPELAPAPLRGPELSGSPPADAAALPADAATPPSDAAAEPPAGAEASPSDATAEPPAGAEASPADAPPALAPVLRRSWAEDLLPPPPRSGGRRALLFFSLALLAASLAEVAERLQDRVRPTGALPRLLSAATGVGRGALIPLLLVALLSLLPRSWSLAVPFAVVALAFALGWSARELLADLFAGIVLTVERRVRPGERIELGPHRGLVHGLGLRTTRLTVDDGRMVSIPNRQLLVETLRVDPDAYAPVQVPVPVHPHLSVGEVRQTLHELALLSPYIAPSRPPNVYRDADRPDLWIVEARLVHPRYANAFRGALVELADEQLNLRRSEG